MSTVAAYGLGIDVGTTFTAAATWEGGRAAVLALAQRSDSIPSVVYIPAKGTWLVGIAAERRALTEPGQVARAFKRRMGDEVPIRVGDRPVSAVDLTAAVLRSVIELATQRQGEPPAAVTLTVPAEWGPYRRALMEQAAASAGVAVAELAPEPVGAAVYYGAQGRMAAGQTVGVFDLGGGTFDAALVRRTVGGYDIVGRPAGDATVGGLDLDDEVMGLVRRAVADEWATVDTENPDTLAALAALRAQVVLAREALSDDVDTAVGVLLPRLVRTVRLTRPEFESLASPYVDRAIAAFAAMLTREHVDPADLGAVLLVGGTSRMPLVSERLTAHLGRPVVLDAHPKYAVCLGAAILAGARMSRGDVDPGVTRAVDGRSLQPSPPTSPVHNAPSPGKPAVIDRNAGAANDATSGRRRSRVWIAADLAQAGLATPDSRSTTAADSSAGARRHEPLVVRTPPRATGRARVIAAAVAVAAAVALVTWLLVQR